MKGTEVPLCFCGPVAPRGFAGHESVTCPLTQFDKRGVLVYFIDSYYVLLTDTVEFYEEKN